MAVTVYTFTICLMLSTSNNSPMGIISPKTYNITPPLLRVHSVKVFNRLWGKSNIGCSIRITSPLQGMYLTLESLMTLFIYIPINQQSVYV